MFISSTARTRVHPFSVHRRISRTINPSAGRFFVVPTPSPAERGQSPARSVFGVIRPNRINYRRTNRASMNGLFERDEIRYRGREGIRLLQVAEMAALRKHHQFGTTYACVHFLCPPRTQSRVREFA